MFSHDRWQFLAIGLDHAPTKDAVCWARKLIARHPQHRVILTTHCYLNTRGEHARCAVTDSGKYNIVGMDGADLWNELVSLDSNIVLIASGHINGNVHRERNSAASNRVVHEILVDYQDERRTNDAGVPRSDRKHGNGWIKTLQVNGRTGAVVGDSVRTIGPRTRFNDVPPPDPDDHRLSFNLYRTLPPDVHLPAPAFIDQAVNLNKTRDQRSGSVAVAPDGHFVVVWEDDAEAPADVYEIFGRRFDNEGCGDTKQFRVNQNSARQQLRPDVGIGRDGVAIVAWEDDSAGPAGKYQIYMRGIRSDGSTAFGATTVNTVATGDQREPRVAVEPEGSFVVAWRDGRSASDKVYVRRFNGDGTPHPFGERVLHAAGSAPQGSPDVALGNNTAVIVVWQAGGDVYASVRRADGSVDLQPMRLSQSAGGWQGRPSVAALPNGGFVAAWEDCTATANVSSELAACTGSNRRRVKARRFNAQGAGDAEVQVSASDTHLPALPRIASNASGHFIVVWQDDSDGNGSLQIKRNVFSPAPSGPQTVNKNDRGQQLQPDAAVQSLPDGTTKWVIVWTDDLDKNRYTQVLARGGEL